VITSTKAALKALNKRKKEADKPVFSLSEVLFKEQLDFVLDPAPNKIAVCSRRAGKTVSCATDLIHTALSNPGVVCLYITLSRNNAKKIIWREIKRINREKQLGGVENLSELSMTFPNSSIVYLSGAKDTNEIEKFRGLALKLVYIDEAQSFREYISELIDDVLSPALMDYSGTLVLIGTPPPIPTGYFCDAFQEGKGWSKHHWTFWNNPFILDKSKKTHQQMLDRELLRRGVNASDPSIQREWFGKFTLDSDSLLLHYNPQVNHYSALPNITPHRWNYIMGIDLGFDDADAIAVLAWSDQDPTTYLVEEKVVPQQGLTELVQQIQEMQKRYDITKIVIDQGGLGKKLAEEMRRRHHIPVQPADKVRKMENIAFLNDALRTGRFKALKDSKFAQDTYLVEIDKDKSTPDKIKVSDRYHSDIIDSVLYAFRESPAYSYEPPIQPLKPGTKEWADQQQDEMWDKAQEFHQEQAELESKFNPFNQD
jgi:hypothetical protein